MKKIQYSHFGDNSVLEMIEVATPKPKDFELIIKTEAIGVNPMRLENS